MRRVTKEIKIGNIKIGGNNPIAIQSMTNTSTSDIDATIAQIQALEQAGCDIVRIAVSNNSQASNIRIFKQNCNVPLVADIQYDYKLAIASIENGIDKIRFNPGNIGSYDKVKMLVDCSKANNVPIRIGVNGGSADKKVVSQLGLTPQALANSCMEHVKLLESLNYSDIVLSVKSSDVNMMIKCNQIIADMCNYPIHLGVTEAGVYEDSIIKSSIGIGSLLERGIGDTIRVSITGDPVREVQAAKDILKALNMYSEGVEFVSCPTCSRCTIPLEQLVYQAKQKFSGIKEPLKIAIMGCPVNGIGEASTADFGCAGGAGKGVIFSKGKIICECKQEEIIDKLAECVNKYLRR